MKKQGGNFVLKYLKAWWLGNGTYNRYNLSRILLMLLYIAAIFTITAFVSAGNIESDDMSGFFVAFGIAPGFLIGGAMGFYRFDKPSAVSLVPISYKKKCLCDFIVMVLLHALCVAYIAVLMSLFGILLPGLISLSEGMPFFETTGQLFNAKYNACGVLFYLFLYILIFGAGAVLSYIRKNGFRVIFTVVFTVAVCLYTFLLTGLGGGKMPDGNFSVNTDLTAIAGGWAALLVIALAACGMLACYVYMSLKFHKPKNY